MTDWNRGEWLAWRPPDLEHNYRKFQTRREAEAWALGEATPDNQHSHQNGT